MKIDSENWTKCLCSVVNLHLVFRIIHKLFTFIISILKNQLKYEVYHFIKLNFI